MPCPLCQQKLFRSHENQLCGWSAAGATFGRPQPLQFRRGFFRYYDIPVDDQRSPLRVKIGFLRFGPVILALIILLLAVRIILNSLAA